MHMSDKGANLFPVFLQSHPKNFVMISSPSLQQKKPMSPVSDWCVISFWPKVICNFCFLKAEPAAHQISEF